MILESKSPLKMRKNKKKDEKDIKKVSIIKKKPPI